VKIPQGEKVGGVPPSPSDVRCVVVILQPQTYSSCIPLVPIESGIQQRFNVVAIASGDKENKDGGLQFMLF
jgi:hypothetical protein